MNENYFLEGDLRIIIKDTSDQKLDTETRNLLGEIKRIVNSAKLTPSDTRVAGTRNVDLITVGGLLISILPTAIPEFIRFLRDWCLRSENRTVEIEIKYSRKQSVKVKISGDISSEKLNEIITSITALPQGKK